MATASIETPVCTLFRGCECAQPESRLQRESANEWAGFGLLIAAKKVKI
jgi:hypothetical protein